MTIESQSVPFPNEPHFKRLVQYCIESPDQAVVYDEGCKIEASYKQLLRDVQATRRSLVDSLPPSLFGNNRFIISKNQTLFVSVLAPGNYEFLVAALSVLATGGALLPFATSITPEEASHRLQKGSSNLLLASPALLKHATDIQQHELSLDRKITVLPIQTGTSSAMLPIPVVDEDAVIPPSLPCILPFTSGTTGAPKGMLIPRSLLDRQYLPRKGIVTLFCRNPNHMSGFTEILWTVFMGGTLDIVPRDAAVLWERLCKWDATALASTPPLWRQIMDYFQSHIEHLPTEKRDQYIRAARGLRWARAFGAVASPSLMEFWRGLGRPLSTAYGSTEAGGSVMMSTDETDPHLKYCIGRPLPGVSVRLSQGDEGELLIKTPTMFTHFVDDEAATRAAFTDDGFYKTGDLVRRVGDDYVMLGRASADFIRYYGHRIPVLELESHLKDIPSVAEAYVLSIPDAYTCARVGVLVRFEENSESSKNELGLGYIRAHLADKLTPYKLPTVMRTLQEGESVYKTETDKIMRQKTREKFFPVSETFALPAGVEVWNDDIKNTNVDVTKKDKVPRSFCLEGPEKKGVKRKNEEVGEEGAENVTKVRISRIPTECNLVVQN